MTRKTGVAFIVLGLATVSIAAFASVHPSERHEAGGAKTNRYISAGFFAGGEHTVTSAKLKDIRRGKQSGGFERIVFDLEAQADDKEAVPYFQVQAAPEEGRFIMSIWANVLYDFDSTRVSKTFTKSEHFKRINVIPRLEEGLTIIEFTIAPETGKQPPKFEVFRLSHPARIIMDVI